MTAHFVSNQESPYYETETYRQVMQYIISHPKRCALKEAHAKLILTIKEVSTVTQALEIVRAMESAKSES
jgi:transcription-repair coupling factor (superfamily II helicase)